MGTPAGSCMGGIRPLYALRDCVTARQGRRERRRDDAVTRVTRRHRRTGTAGVRDVDVPLGCAPVSGGISALSQVAHAMQQPVVVYVPVDGVRLAVHDYGGGGCVRCPRGRLHACADPRWRSQRRARPARHRQRPRRAAAARQRALRVRRSHSPAGRHDARLTPPAGAATTRWPRPSSAPGCACSLRTRAPTG